MKLSHFIIALSLLVFFSCEKEGTGVNPETIKGDWKAQSFVLEGSSKATAGGVEVETTFKYTGKDIDYTLSFTDTNFSTNGSYSYEGFIKVNNVEVDQNHTLNSIMSNGTYSIEGDSITFNGSLFSFEVDDQDFSNVGVSQSAYIEKLTDTELILIQEAEQTASTAGATATNKTKSRSVWKKQ